MNKRKHLTRQIHSDVKNCKKYLHIYNAGHAAFLKILLATNNDEEIPLGTGMLGVNGKEKAREFADKISKSLSLSVIDESSVE